MFERFSLFFNSKCEQHFEGPNCFYTFDYKDRKIILIGERHYGTTKACNLSIEQKEKYRDTFNTFIENTIRQNKKIKILLETPQIQENISLEFAGFIDCLAFNGSNSQVEVIATDYRKRCEAIDSFILSTIGLENLEKFVKSELKKKTGKTFDVVPFDNDLLPLTVVKEWLSPLGNRLTLEELNNAFTKEMDEILLCIEAFKKLGFPAVIIEFIELCYIDTCTGFEELMAIAAKYSLYTVSNGFETITMEDLCINMMLQEGNYSPVYYLRRIIDTYASGHLDMGLFYHLCFDIYDLEDRSSDIFIIATGSNHTKRIAGCLEKLCHKTYDIQNPNYSLPISPEELQKYLYKEELTCDTSCAVM